VSKKAQFTQERVEYVFLFDRRKNVNECGRNAREAARVFSERFPNRNHPDHKVINTENDGKDGRDRSSSTKS
jgi:hypothetical protein